MKILHLTPLYQPHVGGIEKHLLLLNREHLERGHHIQVISQRHQAELLTNESIENVQVLRMPIRIQDQHQAPWQYKLSIWREIWRMLPLLQAADRVHIHDVFWWLLPVLPFLNRKKLSITFHGYEGANPPNWRQIGWHRLAAFWTNSNLCVGDFHRKWYGVSPTLTTYGAVEVATKNDAEVSQHTAAKQSESTVSKHRIIYIGRLSEDSGIAAYIKAAQLLQQEKVAFQLDVYGAGELRAKLEKVVKKHKLPVKFYGATAQAAAKLPNYSIAFVSRYLAILEALAVQLPIIAHYNNQIKYDYLALAPFAQEVAIVQTPSEIATAVKNILQQKNATNYSAATKNWISKQTWSHMADLYEKLWQT